MDAHATDTPERVAFYDRIGKDNLTPLWTSLANPITGNHAMATMGTFVQLLPKGFATAAYRSTDATVFVPIEGRGRSIVSPRAGGGEDFVVDWGKRDVFIVPSWQKVRHEAAEDSVLFSFSDRPIQQALHLFRGDRGNA